MKKPDEKRGFPGFLILTRKPEVRTKEFGGAESQDMFRNPV
jgi:hypothetical protein